MKKVILIAMVVIASLSGRAQTATEAWATIYPEIEKQIKAPTFRAASIKTADIPRQGLQAV